MTTPEEEQGRKWDHLIRGGHVNLSANLCQNALSVYLTKYSPLQSLFQMHTQVCDKHFMLHIHVRKHKCCRGKQRNSI